MAVADEKMSVVIFDVKQTKFQYNFVSVFNCFIAPRPLPADESSSAAACESVCCSALFQ